MLQSDNPSLGALLAPPTPGRSRRRSTAPMTLGDVRDGATRRGLGYDRHARSAAHRVAGVAGNRVSPEEK
jgi:hypothetical protein